MDAGQSRSRALVSALRRQLMLLIAAAAAGGAALWFIYAERWSLVFTRRLLALSPALPALIVAVGMVLICRLRDRIFPGTEGTGIPQAIAALQLGEGPARTRLLSARIAIGKLILLTLGLFSGATIGREGPSVHVAACALYLSRHAVAYPAHLLERGLILAGGAAGIAAAFNAPIAGIVFAVEEIGRSFDKANLGTITRTVVVACLVCMVPLSNYYFYGRVEADLRTWGQWLLVPVLGIGCGLLGGCFARAVAATTPRVVRLMRRRPYAVAGSLGATLAMLGLISGGDSYGAGDAQALAILRGQPIASHYPLVKALASFVTLISGIPGGLFTPSLSVGAGLGQLVLPFVPAEMSPQAVVVLAMGAYFAGVVQSPITAAVIMLEMTGVLGMALPLLATTILAYGASRLVCPVAVYEALAAGFVARLADSPLVARRSSLVNASDGTSDEQRATSDA
jgi:H+/Cl- antiporter ClcA